MKNLFAHPLFGINMTAGAAPIDPAATPVEVAAPLVTLQGPTSEQIATMTVADLAKVKGDIDAAASLALATIEQAIQDAEAKAEIVAGEIIVAEQTFCQQHAIAIGALNTWAAVIGGIVVLKLLGVI